jgi:hypothetical protein
MPRILLFLSGSCLETSVSEPLYSKTWFNTPPLEAENWGCGGFVPPQAQRFQGEIFNTPELVRGFFIKFAGGLKTRACKHAKEKKDDDTRVFI